MADQAALCPVCWEARKDMVFQCGGSPGHLHCIRLYAHMHDCMTVTCAWLDVRVGPMNKVVHGETIGCHVSIEIVECPTATQGPSSQKSCERQFPD